MDHLASPHHTSTAYLVPSRATRGGCVTQRTPHTHRDLLKTARATTTTKPLNGLSRIQVAMLACARIGAIHSVAFRARND